jgi:hypothetical protein
MRLHRPCPGIGQAGQRLATTSMAIARFFISE